ncbi:MAG: hypothetical protein FD119_3806 [Stygiobacter sp.]|nr:MAG: hypothetical protein FD119_3806 [Stygiobacter sp.]
MSLLAKVASNRVDRVLVKSLAMGTNLALKISSRLFLSSTPRLRLTMYCSNNWDIRSRLALRSVLTVAAMASFRFLRKDGSNSWMRSSAFLSPFSAYWKALRRRPTTSRSICDTRKLASETKARSLVPFSTPEKPRKAKVATAARKTRISRKPP